MSVETQERPQVEEQEQKCEECKHKTKYQDTVYKKLLELEDVSHEKMAKTIQMDAKENNDPLSRFLVHLVETSPIEDKKTLWNELCKTLLAHYTWEEIENKVEEISFAMDRMAEVNGDNCVLVKAINGKKTAIMTFPLELLKNNNLETDEDIIKFAKEKAPDKAFLEDTAEYKIIRGEDLNAEMKKNQELLLEQLKGEDKCQTNKEQMNQQ